MNSPFAFVAALMPWLAAPVLPAVAGDGAPGEDPLAHYVAGGPPEILREIPAPSDAPPAPAGVTLRHLLFRSYAAITADGLVTNEVYAVVATPVGAGPSPGILVLHGGGETCDVAGALRWASRGYLAVAVDLPSIGNPKHQVSTGAWKSLPYAADRFKASPDVTVSKVFDAVIAGVHGFKLLQSQPNVDRSRLGIVGVSWGGYMTTMLSGLLGGEVRAAYAIYGSGFYEKATFRKELNRLARGERNAWLRTLDAGRRAAAIRGAFFFAAAANDTFFYPPAVQATYERIPARKAVVFVPNANHRLLSNGDGVDVRTMDQDWFDHHLKGQGAAFPVVTLQPATTAEAEFAFVVSSVRPLVRAQLFYALGDDPWPAKAWRSVDAVEQRPAEYRATIPSSEPDRRNGDGVAYVFVTDDRGVSVSSPMRSFRFDAAVAEPETLPEYPEPSAKAPAP